MSGSLFLCSLTSTGLNIKLSSHDQYYRCPGLFLNPGSNFAISAHKNPIYFSGHQNLIPLCRGVQRKKESMRNLEVYNSVQPGVPPPSEPPSSGSWKGWMVGIVLTGVLPILIKKWGPFLKLKFNTVENLVQNVEDAVDAVENVAEQVEKVAEDIADDLPAGELKNAVTFVENVADQIDHTTEVVGDVIDKVQEVEEQAESAIESAGDGKKDTVGDEAKKSVKEVKAEVGDEVKGLPKK